MFSDYMYDYMIDCDQYTWFITKKGNAHLIMDLQLWDC